MIIDIINVLSFQYNYEYFEKIKQLLLYLNHDFKLSSLLYDLMHEDDNSNYKELLKKLNDYNFKKLLYN